MVPAPGCTAFLLDRLDEIDAYEVASLNISITNFNARNSTRFYPWFFGAWEESEFGGNSSQNLIQILGPINLP